jgi:hypothetical protein
VLAGVLDVAEDVDGPLDLSIVTKKCSQKGKNCIPLPETTIESLCDKLSDRNAFWTKFVDDITPRLGCPVKKGTYTFNNATLDLNVIKGMPLEGYQFHTTFRVTAGDAKKVVFCVDSIADIHAAN